ncbi:hypothetical protein SKTS_06090 [Sulfurimicrobium lacus]|uniref:Uncharacterized protein n=1 Tax=Sulfurimicrobium lacus TaxID=2715678 RepID=A0A6F8V7B1_9PROT|nr:hypothetical protein [Sulfurimicrobium lacus]BCB25723.1 hypothetical protein SKTS_06090 [Sulfurimicrobium lacus]
MSVIQKKNAKLTPLIEALTLRCATPNPVINTDDHADQQVKGGSFEFISKGIEK